MGAGINFNEYRGVKGLVIAELTETVNTQGEVVATYGTPQALSGVQKVGGEVAEGTETHYYDDVPAIVIDSEGEDTYSLTVSIPEKKTRALIEGTTYDTATGALISTPKKKKYFALGFTAEKTDGTIEKNWVYKGKFSGGGKEHNTKTDGAETSNMEYTFTSIHTNEVFTKTGGKPCKYLSVEDNGKVDLKDFFKTVIKPDDLVAVA